MSAAIRFLHAMAQALSAISLYSPGHPAAKRAFEQAWDALSQLLQHDPRPTFLFLGGAPIHQGRALHELSDWPWAARLKDIGIQRLEFDESVSESTLIRFLELVQLRVTTGAAPEPLFPEEAVFEGVRFGPVAVLEAAEEEAREQEIEEDAESRELALSLTDELEATAFILAEARRGVVARSEADAVVRILAAQLDRHELPQAAAIEDPAVYPQFHAVNTSLLSMAVGTSAGIDHAGRHRLGIAGLLHDIGMTQLPEDLSSRESLSDEERALVESHTSLGAKFLVELGGRSLDLAAAVALEHHLRPDGNGYPQRRFEMPPHWASRLVGACAAYVALRAPRPFRPAWSPLRAIAYLEEGAGTVFDTESARALASLLRVTPND